MTSSSIPRPATWAIVVAFLLVYFSWGTTYLATREGVSNQNLPPALFGGTRLCLAGCVLLSMLWLTGKSIRLPKGERLGLVVSSMFLFVGGNGLITASEKTVESGMAAVLVATTPLWLALLELLWPHGDRLSPRGWIGLMIGLCGVLLLLSPKLHAPAHFFDDPGPAMALGSAACWALGSLIVRYQPRTGSHLASAAYQLIVGGSSLTLLGLLMGEYRLIPEQLGPRAWFVFFYLLIVGSLVGFVSFNWLLGHVSATLVGTYAYVNPLIAVVVGWLIADEELTSSMLGGMVIILSGVALVRGAGGHVKTSGIIHELDRTEEGGLTGLWQNLPSPRKSESETSG